MIELLEKMIVKLSQENRNELLQGYAESFPDFDEQGLIDAMLDNASDSQEVLGRHLEWIFSRVDREVYAEEQKAFCEWDQATSIE